ncbi:hypothetical protein [Leisingera sp. ANG59]|uniref:hypothetical protein n=1 Tax=Leisingera sp. ANG59 TaxID=2675221 RepID=UPI001573F6ED|nr:hypothetical protein [Leisingera sp. ANG59]NSY36845.1 hypothetical protein [Leisingera sp. ANG59]
MKQLGFSPFGLLTIGNFPPKLHVERHFKTTIRKGIQMKVPLWACCLAALPAAAIAANFNEEEIKAHCASEWAGDFSMQAYCIKEQRDGFDAVEAARGALDADMSAALTRCESEWPVEWSMVAYCLNEQQNGRQAIPAHLNGLPADVSATVRNTCEGEWQGDFAMQAYCIKEQATGWRSINN